MEASEKQASWLRSPGGGLLWAGLLVVGIGLWATSVPGVFIVDEDHHLAALRALQSGSLNVPDFEELQYSRELAYFDPAARHRGSGNVTTAVPPLYAVVALPFYQLGWFGLVLLNIAGFLACGLMVFAYCRGRAEHRHTPWLALLIFLLAGFSIEYAQGLWPHTLAMALCLGGLFLASRVRDGGPIWLCCLAGLLTGLAAGIRYQNIIFAICVGLGLVIWARRRLRAGGLYLAGLAVPLVASSLLNHLRYGSFNPISKGSYYLSVRAGNTLDNPLVESLRVFWAKVVDFSSHPPLGQTLQQTELLLFPDPDTGAFLLLGQALKKAWLQSCPWVLLALTALLLAWGLALRANFTNQGPNTKSRELRSMFLIVGATLAAFSLAGFERFDGLCFNQRYFLELVPLAAVALAWWIEDIRMKPLYGLLGCLLGAGLAALPLIAWQPTDGARQIWLQKMPLVLAGLALAGWILARRKGASVFLPIVLGACLSWSTVIHLGEDLPATNFVRKWRRGQQDAVAKVLPDGPAAVFAYWGYKDGLGPLQIDRDLVIADPWIDKGQDAHRLAGELLAAGRRVFVLAEGMPKKIFDRISEGRRYRLLTETPYPILEVAEPRDEAE